jgi:ankyrin repeat protein
MSNSLLIPSSNHEGKRPLHLAARADLLTTCDLLLKLGAKVDSQDGEKVSYLAVKY